MKLTRREFIETAGGAFVAGIATTNATAGTPLLEKLELFRAGEGGYALYRIPGLLVTRRGSLLAWCEARKRPSSDWGTIDIQMRRSTDGGKTFDAPRTIANVEGPKQKNPAAIAQKLGTNDEVTYNNPVMIADKNGAVHFLFCLEYMRCFYARAWAKSIREHVVSRTMPPWRADPQHSQFANDARLSAQEIETVRRWVDEGAKEGDPKDLPPAHEIKRIAIRNFLFQIPAGAERHRVTACYTFDRAVRALGKGKVVLFACTQEGHSWQLRSNDDGKTWSEPRFLAVSSKMTTRHLFGAEPYVTLTYSDALADKGQLHIFIPHLWRQVLHVRMSERDLLKLPTKRDLFPGQ